VSIGALQHHEAPTFTDAQEACYVAINVLSLSHGDRTQETGFPYPKECQGFSSSMNTLLPFEKRATGISPAEILAQRASNEGPRHCAAFFVQGKERCLERSLCGLFLTMPEAA
jgi:hypothetical protein